MRDHVEQSGVTRPRPSQHVQLQPTLQQTYDQPLNPAKLSPDSRSSQLTHRPVNKHQCLLRCRGWLLFGVAVAMDSSGLNILFPKLLKQSRPHTWSWGKRLPSVSLWKTALWAGSLSQPSSLELVALNGSHEVDKFLVNYNVFSKTVYFCQSQRMTSEMELILCILIRI